MKEGISKEGWNVVRKRERNDIRKERRMQTVERKIISERLNEKIMEREGKIEDRK